MTMPLKLDTEKWLKWQILWHICVDFTTSFKNEFLKSIAEIEEGVLLLSLSHFPTALPCQHFLKGNWLT